MPIVREVNDIDELASFRLVWNSLLPQTRQATFFQSLDWLEVYWRHFGRGQKLRVLVVSSTGRPVGILPLCVRTEPTRLGPLRVLTYPLDGWGSVYAPVGPNPTATLFAGLEHIRRTPRDWDLLDLRWVSGADGNPGRTRRAMAAAGFRPHQQPWTRGAAVDLAGSTWEQHGRSRPGQWRCHLDRLRQRLARRGPVVHVRYRPEGRACGDEDPRWDLYDACTRLAGDGWNEPPFPGTSRKPTAVARYLRDAHVRAAKAGALDVNLLLVGGRPTAFAYGYQYRGNVVALRTGVEARLGPDEPGAMLQAMLIEDSFGRGDAFYDMGPGPLETNRPWQTSATTSYRVTHFPAAVFRAQVMRLARWLEGRFGDPHAAADPQSA
jgi:CelD/BcsL family acetyltransferase involved in cellulose biosynthesis